MKVLLTGSTSLQSNKRAHQMSACFPGLVWETLRSKDTNHVEWLEPSVTWDGEFLSQYDHVIVGLASPMAMGANRVYGALSVIGHMWGQKNLTVLLDAPDPGLLTRGLRSAAANWDSFTKEFFSYRKEFELARGREVNIHLQGTVLSLLNEQWPTTIVPGLPWSHARETEVNLPAGALGRVQTVNLDALLLGKFGGLRSGIPRLGLWSVESSSDQRWLRSLALGLPVSELKANHRIETDSGHVQQLRESIGFLAGPVQGTPWWTPKIAMALSQLTPVFTDWTRSRVLGPAWSQLAGPHELKSHEEIRALALEQYDAYSASITKPSELLKTLNKAAGIRPPKTRKAMAS